MPKDQPIQLILIHDSQSEAEPIVSKLRQLGRPVHSYFIASEGELEQQLAQRQFDLAVIKLSTQTVNALTCIKTLRQHQPAVPRLVMLEEWKDQTVSQALALGSHAMCTESELDLMQHESKQLLEFVSAKREVKHLKLALQEAEQRNKLLLDSSMDAIAYVHEGMHIFANQAYLDLFGYDDMDEMSCVPIMDMVDGSDLPELKKHLKQYDDNSSAVLPCKAVHSNGEKFPARITFSGAFYEEERCIQLVIRRNDANNAELQAKLDEMKQQDLLTGLLNQQAFSEAVASAHATAMRSSKAHRSLHYIQLTNMMEIKSDLGIAAADVVLADAAEQLRNTAKVGEIGRLADDVFAWLAPSNLASPEGGARKLQQILSQHLYEVEGKTIPVKVVIGVSLLDEMTEDVKQCFTEAHQAANNAKAANQPVMQYDRSDAANVADEGLAKQIEHALKYDHFSLRFQPIVSLRDDPQETYEALLRMQSGDKEHFPHEILSTAEAAGLSMEVDRWVVETAIGELAEHRRQGSDTKLLVHLTPSTVRDSAFLPWVNGILRKNRLPGDSVVFQISEENALTYLKAAKAFSKALGVLKCRLAIGGFGYLEDGLSLLKHLQVDYVKVSGEYVKKLDTEEGTNRLKSLIEMAKQHGASAIVPQIEDASTLTTLWSCGADYIQGYYLQEPSTDMSFNFSPE